jgi:hypothetical protein
MGEAMDDSISKPVNEAELEGGVEKSALTAGGQSAASKSELQPG